MTTIPKEVQAILDLRMAMVQSESGFGRVSVKLTAHNTYTVTTEIEDRIVLSSRACNSPPTPLQVKG